MEEKSQRRVTLDRIKAQMEASRRAQMQRPSITEEPSSSAVRTWGQVLAEHERQRQNMIGSFRAEHDWWVASPSNGQALIHPL